MPCPIGLMTTNTTSLALLTDLYQLTMAQGYWKTGMDQHEAVFHLFFRRNPFKGAYSVACGLAPAIEFLQDLGFDESDRAYLATLTGNDGKPLFEPAFLDYFGDLKFTCDLDAIPEGTIAFPQEPLLRVKGPLLQCQLLETPLLTIINFQTLIATKAARVCLAAQGDPVLEFGLRRAQGIDGGLSASRAAYIGGCAGTSNVLAGKLYGIPVKGTHAHSWIMSFDTEQESFEAYARAMPNNCIFLVDTYDTIEGVKRAIDAGRQLRDAGHEMIGIRLDSGDLASLSIEARRLLDEAGFDNAAIVGSSDLDEYAIGDIKKQGGKIAVWGVGTRLATAYDEPALTGVYKIAAIREPGGEWKHRIKLSDEPAKATTPGIQQVRRFSNNGHFQADIIYNETAPPQDRWKAHNINESNAEISPAPDCTSEDLLQPILRSGKLQSEPPPVEQIRSHCLQQLDALAPELKQNNPNATYPVGLEIALLDLKKKLAADKK
jgi:nicotinate phosphoribosyltransferase